MSIRRPGEGKEPPSPLAASQKPLSALAEQTESQGGLLEQIQARHIPRFGGFLGRVEAFFVNRSVKKEYIENLGKTFVSAFDENEKGNAQLAFNSFLKPKLLKTPLEDLPHFEGFIKVDQGAAYLMRPFTTFSVREGSKALTKRVEDVIALGKKGNTESVAAAFTYMPRVAKIIDRMKPVHQFEYLTAWVQAGGELGADQFKDFSEKYAAHLQMIEEMQVKRPKVFEQGSKEEDKLKNSYFELYMGRYAVQMARFELFDLAMRDVTAIVNRQIIQYSLTAFYLEPTESIAGMNTIPDLRLRDATTQGVAVYGLSNQIGIPFTLPKGEDEKIIENFQATTDIYITDPFSMETRSVRVPLPVNGRMTVGEARSQLQLLIEVVHNPKRFDDTYAQLRLPSEKKEELREKFTEFDRTVGIELGRALSDFNTTPQRARESSVRENPTIAAFIANPSAQTALEAAKTKNLFLLEDGTLSLLPGKVGESHRDMGTLSPTELRDATQLLLKGSHNSIPLQSPKGATLQLKTHRENIDGKLPYLIMETSITVEGKTVTRKSYYSLTGKTVKSLKQEIIDSKLFERDLLLAKAECLEKYGQL